MSKESVALADGLGVLTWLSSDNESLAHLEHTLACDFSHFVDLWRLLT